MSENNKFIIISTLLCLASFIAWGSYLTGIKQQDSVDIRAFPKAIDGWVSEDVPLSKVDLEVLETNNVFIRRYMNPVGDVIYLYIIYSQNNRKISHPPEICYTGSGISILENTHDTIPINYKNMTIPVNRLLLQVKDSQQLTFYWFKVGDSFTANYWEQQFNIVFDHFLGKKVGGALIRVSVNVRDKDKQSAVKKGKVFIELIAPYLFKYLP